MTRLTLSSTALPEPMLLLLQNLGTRLRQVRIARGLSRDELADRMFVAPRTLSRLEKGDPAVGLGILASALYVVGRQADLEQVVSLASDRLSAKLLDEAQPKRVRRGVRPAPSDLDF